MFCFVWFSFCLVFFRVLREGGPPAGDRASAPSAKQLCGGAVPQLHPRRPRQVPADSAPAITLFDRAAGEAAAVDERGAVYVML